MKDRGSHNHCEVPMSGSEKSCEPLNEVPLKTEAMHKDDREHPVAKVAVTFPPPGMGRPTAGLRKKLLRASCGLIFVGLTQMLFQRAVREGRAKGRPREVVLREIEKQILHELPVHWAGPTLTDAAEKFAAELSPYPTFKAFKDAHRERGRRHPAGEEEQEADKAWITEQKRILRLLGVAALQDECITAEQHKLGDEVRSHEDAWWEGKESRLEERLLLDAKRQETWRLSLPQMVEVAIHGHVHPADLWHTYELSTPMFDAALCAGWCRIGKDGPITLNGASWLAHYLRGRLSLDSTNQGEIEDYLRSRDLIMGAFNEQARTDLYLLQFNLLREVMAGVMQRRPFMIRVPVEMARPRAA